jgi:hypothetical protein
MGVSDGRQGTRGQLKERRRVMRPPRFDAEVALEGARNEPNRVRPPRACMSMGLPGRSLHTPGARSRSTKAISFASRRVDCTVRSSDFGHRHGPMGNDARA